jgi:hypothetical protein
MSMLTHKSWRTASKRAALTGWSDQKEDVKKPAGAGRRVARNADLPVGAFHAGAVPRGHGGDTLLRQQLHAFAQFLLHVAQGFVQRDLVLDLRTDDYNRPPSDPASALIAPLAPFTRTSTLAMPASVVATLGPTIS